MSCSLSQSRAEYRRKMAAHKANKKNNNKNHMYKPNKTITITCKYCKEEGHKVGHFDKDLGRFVTTCQKAIDGRNRKIAFNQRQRDRNTAWKNQVSKSVAEETGSDGWNTAGSKNKVSAAQKTEKPVLKVAKNRFALDEDSDEETGPTAWATMAPGLGAWSKGAPDKVELARAPRKSSSPVNTDSSDDDAKDQLLLLDEPINIGHGTWHVLNKGQLATIGLTAHQINMVFKKLAKVTDFIPDLQSATDAAFGAKDTELEDFECPDEWGDC